MLRSLFRFIISIAAHLYMEKGNWLLLGDGSTLDSTSLWSLPLNPTLPPPLTRLPLLLIHTLAFVLLFPLLSVRRAHIHNRIHSPTRASVSAFFVHFSPFLSLPSPLSLSSTLQPKLGMGRLLNSFAPPIFCCSLNQPSPSFPQHECHS